MTEESRASVLRTSLGALAVATLFVSVAWPALRENSATYDETLYLPAGYTYLTRADFRLGPDNPWLLKTLFALPVLSLRPAVSAEAERAFAASAQDIDAEWIFGDRFLYRDNRPTELLFRSRLVSVALAVALVLLVYAWAHDLFGMPGALFAGALTALDPNILAHGTLATTDMGATLFFVATAFFVRRAFRLLTGRDALLAGVACAAAFGSKFTATLLVPVLALFWLVRVTRRRPWPVFGRVVSRGSGRALVGATLVAFCGLVTVASLWVAYGPGRAGAPSPGFKVPLASQLRSLRAARLSVDLNERGAWIPDTGALQRMVDRTPPRLTERLIAAGAKWRLVPEQYLSGLAFATLKAQSRASFLLGRISLTGSAAYFPVAFAVKTPSVTLVVLAVALFLVCDARSALRRYGETIWLLGPAGIVALAAIGSRLNIGHRHILPVYPLLYVVAGSLPGEIRRLLGERSAWLTAGAAILAIGMETLSARPYFVSFFNRPAGGPIGGLAILSDSNLDWGQGLPALRRWMTERGVERVNLCYFGTADPAAYGIRFLPLPGSYHVDIPDAGSAGYDPHAPELPGWVAISTTHLQGTYLDRELRDAYRFLRERRPAAMLAGGTIYVYWVDAWPQEE